MLVGDIYHYVVVKNSPCSDGQYIGTFTTKCKGIHSPDLSVNNLVLEGVSRLGQNLQKRLVICWQ